MTSDSVLAAARRVEHAWSAQLSLADELGIATAYACGAFPESPAANLVRDASLIDAAPADAFEQVERHFSQRGATCLRWVPAAGEPVEPHAALLSPRGWARRDGCVLALRDWPTLPAVDRSVRIVPARAMRRALTATFLDPADGGWSEATRRARAAELAERLNDANTDAFVALIGDEPAGRAVYHEVGDLAALRDLYVVSGMRGRGVARAMLAHLLLLARRLSPRMLLAFVPDSAAAARTLLERRGFDGAAATVEFDRHGM
ncbi:MAG: GNAT family N-acetyltransferase [Phycisphaerae bacterium]